MMKFLKPFLAALLAAVLLVVGIPVLAAPSLTVTAVNDTFLPLTSSYMPTRIGGEYFIPYQVFSSGVLGVRASYDSAQQILTLSGTGRTLTYSIAQGYVYDQNMQTYNTPAYSLNGQIYIPVRTVCSFFGLSYSVLNGASALILRICSGTALPDSSFLNSSKAKLSELVDAYNGKTTEEEPEKPPEEEIHKPSLVYLTFFNMPGKHTREILRTLDDFNCTATFFFSPEQEEPDAALLRRIVGENHAIGLALNASTVSPEALVEMADSGNRFLLKETGKTTRVVSPLAGSEALTGPQLEALIQAGYRLWDTTLDSRDNNYSAYRTANTVTDAFSQTDSPVVVRFRDRDATAPALRTVLDYMRTNEIDSSEITVLHTPINARGDLR